MSDLENLKRLARAATPGPWTATEQRGRPGHCFVAQIYGPDDRSVLCADATNDERVASRTAEYVAAANPQTILSLIERVEKAEKDAELGRVAMRFVDRAGDHCPQDTAENICDQFYAAMIEVCEAQLAKGSQQ